MQTAKKTANTKVTVTRPKGVQQRNQVAVNQRKQKVVVAPNMRSKPQAQLFKAPTPKLSALNVAAKGHMGDRGIPRTSNSAARHVAGGPMVDNNLKKKSPWFQSIQNPAQGGGIKIPDDVAIETGTLQCCLEATFNAFGSGVGGFRTVALHPNARVATGPNGTNYQTMWHESNNIKIEWGDSAVGAAEGFATTPPLIAYAQGVRVVSAAVYVESEASLASAKGELICGFNGYAIHGLPSLGGGTPLTDYRNNYGTSIMPLNTCQPMKVLWTPFNKDQQTYSSFMSPNHTSLGAQDNKCPEWELFVICNGADPGTAFRVRLIVNYEFIPRENVIDIISANPSPVDSTDVDLTEAWVAETPVTRPVSAKEMSANPGAQIMEALPQDGGDTGFGMFFEVLKELVPFAIEGATMLL